MPLFSTPSILVKLVLAGVKKVILIMFYELILNIYSIH